MKTPTYFIVVIAFLLIACNDESEPNQNIEPNILSNSTNLILGQNESLSFEFNECNFDLFGDQRPLNSSGFINVNSEQWNLKTLHTQLSSNNNKLGIKAIFLKKPDLALDDEISFEDIKTILESEINDKLNSRFGFEIQLTYENKSYVSTERNIEFDGANNPFEYYNFNFDITANHDYISECNEEKTLQISGNFDGWLINISNGVKMDSIYINETTFDILLLNN